MPENPHACDRLLVRVDPQNVAMFRFLLEARDNLAIFTVLEKDSALLRLMFAHESRNEALAALAEIDRSLPLTVLPWPASFSNPSRPS